ncbi:hypothetical protein SAMN05216259_102607 [Actinacidiphila guanduensis]|uniref:Thymidylate kinase n=2 Tax=Actinacidiphila guanduensis TaxID=310781 RepID=A0A1G9YK32_9ACTN|nr:hypothetical protein SAMN05216259_102607 [Actinacidiphila guanduensis]
MGGMPDFISLNGPDNVGKTTQLRRLARRWERFQMLGAVHEHDPGPWERAAADDYATWWFETSTTVELTSMLAGGHAKRAAAREPERTGLLDRGLPMLIAVAAATSVVKEGLSAREALWTVREIAGPISALPETSVLLIPSLDPDRSYAITSARESRPWTGIYPAYQKVLHEILLRQAEEGAYDLVVDCEHHNRADVHERIVEGLGIPLPAEDLGEDDDQ